MPFCTDILTKPTKVVHVPLTASVEQHDLPPPGFASFILLDTSVTAGQSSGGTGVSFDWKIAHKYQQMGLPVIVAGGLTSENVQEAVRQAGVPFAVDCSSGVQRSAREKDPALIRAFVSAAKQAQ
jgi:phosphoribosylanthranilate isomerase